MSQNVNIQSSDSSYNKENIHHQESNKRSLYISCREMANTFRVAIIMSTKNRVKNLTNTGHTFTLFLIKK